MESKKTVRRLQKIKNADIFEPLVTRDLTRNRVLDEILGFFGGRAGKLTQHDVRELENTIRRLKAQQRQANKGGKSK